MFLICVTVQTFFVFVPNWAQNQKRQLARNHEISCACGRKYFGHHEISVLPKKTNTVRKQTVSARIVARPCFFRLEETILIIIVTDIVALWQSGANYSPAERRHCQQLSPFEQ